MALLRERPHLSLRAPRARAGSLFEALLVVDAEDAVPVDAFTLRLRGVEQTCVGDRIELCALEGRLDIRGVVESGRSLYELAFELPSDLPPSYAGRHLTVEYRLEVRAEIPWWPDAHGTFAVTVDGRPPADEPSRDIMHVLPEGPLTLVLDAGPVMAGGALTGLVGLAGKGLRGTPALDLTLVSFERLPRDEQQRARIPLGKLAVWPEQRFTVAVPRATTASFRGRLGGLRWELWAATRTTTITLPVVIATPLDQGRWLPQEAGLHAIEELWQEVAAERSLRYTPGGGIEGEAAGGALLEVQRRVRAARPLVEASLRFRPLRLGHDEARRKSLEERLAADLKRLPRAHLRDDHLVATLADAGRKRARLAELCDAALQFAARLAVEREALPPPEGADVAAWRDLAARLGGELQRGDFAILGGRSAGLAVEVLPRFGFGLASVTLRVALRGPAPPEWLGRRIDLMELGGEPARLRTRASRELPCPITCEAQSLVLALADLPRDPRDLEGQLVALQALADALLVHPGGPYR